MIQERLYASIDALQVFMYQARHSKHILRQLTQFLFLGYHERPNASIDAYPVSYVSRVPYALIDAYPVSYISRVQYASIDAFPVFMHKERSNVSIVVFHVPCVSIDALVAFYVSRKTMCVN